MERILGNTTVEFGLLDYNTAWSRSFLQISTMKTETCYPHRH